MPIGTSAYKLVLDSTKFVEGATLSRRETAFLKQTLRETATSTEVMGAAIDRLGELQKKGALTAEQYERAEARVKQELNKPIDAEVIAEGSPFGPKGSMFGGLMPNLDVINLASRAFEIWSNNARMLGEHVRASLNEVDDLLNKSETLGISAEAFQNISGAADLADVSIQQTSSAIEKMLVAISKGDTGKFAVAFEKAGISAKEFRDAAPDEAFARILQAVQGIGNQADRVRVANQLFGNADVLRISADSIAEISKQLEAMGGHVKDIDAEAFNEFDRASKELSHDMQALTRRFALELAPALGQTVKLFDDLTRSTGPSGQQQVKQMGDTLSGLAFSLRELLGSSTDNRAPLGASIGQVLQSALLPNANVGGSASNALFGQTGEMLRQSRELDAKRRELKTLQAEFDAEEGPTVKGTGPGGLIDSMYEEDRALDAVIEKYRRRREEITMTGRELEVYRAKQEGLHGAELEALDTSLWELEVNRELARIKKEDDDRAAAARRAARETDIDIIRSGSRDAAKLFARSGSSSTPLTIMRDPDEKKLLGKIADKELKIEVHEITL